MCEDKCQFCGSEYSGVIRGYPTWECFTVKMMGGGPYRHVICYQRQIAALQAEVERLLSDQKKRG